MKAGLVIPDKLGLACSPKECGHELPDALPGPIQPNQPGKLGEQASSGSFNNCGSDARITDSGETVQPLESWHLTRARFWHCGYDATG
jgi:hypothetical protein